MIPRSTGRLKKWLERLGSPVTLKLSFNHHLLEKDPGLPELAIRIRDALRSMGEGRQFVLNVRLRRGVADDDRAVLEALQLAGLASDANVFYLQRYGFAAEEYTWEEPHLAGLDFRLVNPDGAVFGPELIVRSEAMRRLR